MAELERQQIKARIAQARVEAGLTQTELADIVEPPVHWRTIQDWESPRNSTVPFRHLNSIAAATSRSVQWLLHGTDEDDQRHDVLELLRERDDLAARQHEELLSAIQALAEQLRGVIAAQSGRLRE